MLNINDRDIGDKISQVEGNRWDKSQIEKARNGEISTIYGSIGVARYYVGENGEVSYSLRHGTQAQKAQEVGFEINDNTWQTGI